MLRLRPYIDQKDRFRGQVIAAQFDAENVVLYPLERSGGTQWLTPAFLLAMDAAGWSTDAFIWRVSREGFDALLAEAVLTRFNPAAHPDEDAWRAALAGSAVRAQWESDRSPRGIRLKRKVLRLGVGGTLLDRLHTDWLLAREDIGAYVGQQAQVRYEEDFLLVPVEKRYPVSAAVAARLAVEAS